MQSTFTTPRLLLSSLALTHDEFILALVNTPGWLRFIGDRNIHSAEDARAYINKIIQNPNYHYWMVELTDEHIPIGVITFIKRDYLEFPDIGFAFLPAYAKMGYAFEATTVVLNYLSAETLFRQLLAITIPGNVDSISLLTRLGFELKSETEVDREKLLVYEFGSVAHSED
jgi:ribosomal-protein-alanine N-acetyltransferase